MKWLEVSPDNIKDTPPVIYKWGTPVRSSVVVAPVLQAGSRRFNPRRTDCLRATRYSTPRPEMIESPNDGLGLMNLIRAVPLAT